MQYEAATGMQRLCEFFVSKASADQRKGLVFWKQYHLILEFL